MTIFAWNVPLVSLIFLKRFLIFPTLLFSFISLHCSLKKAFLLPCYSLELCIQLGISFLFSLSFHFTSFLTYLQSIFRQAFCLLAFLFPWDGFGQCLLYNILVNASWTSVHSSSGTLSDLIPWIYLSLPLYNHKGFDLDLNGLVVFPTIFNLSLNFAIRSSWSELQSAPSLKVTIGTHSHS